MHRDERNDETRVKFARLARAIVDGEAPLPEGVRQLLALGHSLGLYDRDRDRDFDFLIGFESDTDSLPYADERKNWDPAALVREDLKIAAAESAWGERVRAACSRLATRFEVRPGRNTQG